MLKIVQVEAFCHPQQPMFVQSMFAGLCTVGHVYIGVVWYFSAGIHISGVAIGSVFTCIVCCVYAGMLAVGQVYIHIVLCLSSPS